MEGNVYEQVSLQENEERLDGARIVVLREEQVKRLIGAIDELKELTDFLRDPK